MNLAYVPCEWCEVPATIRLAPRADLTKAELVCDVHYEARRVEMMVESGHLWETPIATILERGATKL